MWHIEIELEKCTGCGECVEGCPGDVYDLVDGKAKVIHIDECHGCHSCEELCESEAITIKEK